ncbi:cytochrome P450 87A3-like [Telopea speciosissima]|uniref:cytochrome P450 87A3-like n=1 Tax=Telopea speciosissima TaxID=54955 RepID=UPI001CC3E742|nr:cytochrome P450 87A3-like [Telopea speciosissima]
MEPILLFAIAIITIYITHWVYSWRNPKCNGKLPPGSMGIPLLGETLQFFSPFTSNDFSPFIKHRMERYGSIFRTSLVGRPVVVSTDQEFNNFIFQQEGKLFEFWYMDTFTEVMWNKKSVPSLQGYIHKYIRSLILNLTGPQNLKEKLLSEMDQATMKQLQSWSTQHANVDLKEAVATMVLNLVSKKLISYDEEKCSKKLRESFADIMGSLISFPLKIPGTPYYNGLQGRKKAITLIRNILYQRRTSPPKHHGDFLDLMLEEMKKDNTILTEDLIVSLIFALIFAFYETISVSITLTMKFLTDHPSVVEELTKEHEMILQKRENKNSRITWEEYKSMTFTTMVINESLRLGNPIPLILRKTMADVHINGYTIPAGWAVMICPPVTHLDPTKFADPLTFNPWRWKGTESNPGKNFMVFGGGARFCVGAEFAKLQITIFLHHLVTKYRWKVIKGGDILREPNVKFPNGFQVQFLEKHK